MRNSFCSRMSVILLLAFLPACSSRPQQRATKPSLQAGYQALENRQYEQAIAQADAYLQSNPRGPSAAQALYLRGRGFEGSIASDQTQAQSHLQSARSAYIQCLA